MFCINCGKQIVDTARFCNYCGTKVVNFDENPAPSSAEIPENPIQIPVEDVKIPENVENSVDLLKMQNETSGDTVQVSEPPEDSDTPFSEKEEPLSDIQSGAVGAQHSADVYPTSEQLDVNIPISPIPEQSPTGAIPGQLPIGTTPEQSAPISTAPEQSEPITRPAEQPERRYTIGHIVMCLASTALMAIAAGVFAGLYFSVV